MVYAPTVPTVAAEAADHVSELAAAEEETPVVSELPPPLLAA